MITFQIDSSLCCSTGTNVTTSTAHTCMNNNADYDRGRKVDLAKIRSDVK